MDKAVIFDMNGVIINDERIHQQSWKILCKKYNIRLTEEEFKNNIFGRTEADTFTYIFHKRLTPSEIEKLSAERVKIVIEIFKPNLALTDGLLQFLKSLKNKKVPIAIATSSRKPYTNFILDNLKIRTYFQKVVTAEDINKGKPDPEIYLLTAKQLSKPPENCVVFEDTLSGIKSAKAAGMQVIAITTTHKAEELSSADRVIRNFTEITADILFI